MNKINLNHIDFNGGSGGSEGTSNYDDLSNKPKINDVELSGNKTITDLGGESVSNKVTTITTESTDAQYPSAKAVYDSINPTKGSAIPTGGMSPNILYALGTLSGAVTISLATPADSNICNHYFFTFDTGATAPTITWDATITSWMGGSAPTINANKHYEVSVLNDVGVYMEV